MYLLSCAIPMFLLKTNPLRLIILLAGISILGASCSTVKKVSAPVVEKPSGKQGSSAANPVFIENISFRPGDDTKPANTNLSTVKESAVKGPAIMQPVYSADAAGIEALSNLRFKY